MNKTLSGLTGLFWAKAPALKRDKIMNFKYFIVVQLAVQTV
jgi:hypothetical protein